MGGANHLVLNTLLSKELMPAFVFNILQSRISVTQKEVAEKDLLTWHSSFLFLLISTILPTLQLSLLILSIGRLRSS